MGSTFIDFQRIGSRAFNAFEKMFGGSKPQSVYLQFVPGIVLSTVTSNESGPTDGNYRKINSIIAKPHWGQKLKQTSQADEEYRYYPLFRGIVDVPVAGDPVLLCTMGGVQYYLGPLNTAGNPTWNIDHVNLSTKEVRLNYDVEADNRDLIGLSKNFIKDPSFMRLQKFYNEELDNPREDKLSYRDIHGDLMLEGRHGNSIRIGSRDVSPYIIISNGRSSINEVESALDGSILGMFTMGSIRQHFSLDSKIEEEQGELFPFTLASDIIKPEEERKRLMSYLISHVNNEEDATKIIYDYGKLLTVEEVDAGEESNILGSQMFLNSDRIVINSRSDSLFLSAAQNIHIGAANTLTISTEKETIVESSNIYLGRQAKETAPGIITGADVQQGLILGENLREWLDALVDILISANGHCQGAPIPLGVENGPPGSLMPKLKELKDLVIKDSNDIVSIRHFIEGNEER